MFKLAALAVLVALAAASPVQELKTMRLHDGGHYGNPANGCQSDEQPIQVTGLSGDFCSPKCSTFKPCPTDVPSGTTAQPECVLETPGSSSPTQCALICSPSTGGCPTGATCQGIQGTGICTYPQ